MGSCVVIRGGVSAIITEDRCGFSVFRWCGVYGVVDRCVVDRCVYGVVDRCVVDRCMVWWIVVDRCMVYRCGPTLQCCKLVVR